MILEVVLLLILCLVLYIFYIQDPSDYPPGPFKFPMIGSGFPINSDRKCIKMQKKYGDLIMEKVGNYYWLTICDYKLSKEALCKSELTNRPALDTFKIMHEGKLQGIFTSEDEHWKSNRRFFMHFIKDTGAGKTYLEDFIKTEAKEMVTELNKLNGLKTNAKFLEFGALNVIWQLVANRRYDMKDPMVGKIELLAQDFMKCYVSMYMMDVMPIFKRIIPKFITERILEVKSAEKSLKEMVNITQSFIEEHKQNLDRGNPKDLIDLYLLEADNPKYLLKEYISESDLRAIFVDLFIAGAITISLTLQWAIYYMVKFPKILTKLQDELDEVVPRDTLPGLEHKSQLPFCQAMIHEVLRKSSLINFSDPHINSEDIKLCGYKIPKDTIIMTANHFILHDPRYWKNPEEFNPERFLDEDGKFCTPKEGFLPFGIGKRQCPGESLSRSELFIFIAAIFQNFSFSVPDIDKFNIEYDPNIRGMHWPIDQQVYVYSRK